MASSIEKSDIYKFLFKDDLETEIVTLAAMVVLGAIIFEAAKAALTMATVLAIGIAAYIYADVNKNHSYKIIRGT